MKNLIRYFMWQIWHSRLLLFVLLLSFIVHSLGLGFMKGASVNIQGQVAVMGARQALFSSVFLDLFCGSFLSTIFGIWLIPYFYQPQKALLFQTLPLPKWKVLVGHGATVVMVLLLQKAISIMVYFWKFSSDGMTVFKASWIPWAYCQGFETLVFLVVTVGLAVGVLTIGAMGTFIISGIYFFVSQLFALFFEFNWSSLLGVETPKLAGIKAVYDLLPPIGRIVFDLRALYSENGSAGLVLIWASWLLVFSALFLVRVQVKRV